MSLSTVGVFKFGPHILCKVTQVFYVSELSIGLVNLKPALPGHVLVIPKRSVPRFPDLTEAETSDLWNSAKRIGAAITPHFKGTSTTYTLQDGPEAGQTVPSVHVHVIPRHSHDDFAGPDNDKIYDAVSGVIEVRPPRSEEEMADEAATFTKLFDDTPYSAVQFRKQSLSQTGTDGQGVK